MTAIHTEAAFEKSIESHLLANGWLRGDPADFDRERAVFPSQLFSFLHATEAKLMAELAAQHKSGLESGLLDALSKALDSFGSLHVVRKGFKFYGKIIPIACFRPANALNPDTLARYAANRLTVTRQVKFIPGHDDSIDLVLSLNGLPIATVELKSQLTGQNVNHAISQYKKRDPKHTIFRFERGAPVHFAVDPDLVYMTTALAGDHTRFLPFNLGSDGGQGNPANPDGYKTSYLWQQVWERDSFLDIIGTFLSIIIEKERRPDGKIVEKERMVFPRFHQLDAVRKLEAAARDDGPGHNYLVQHSAGSGKSNSIAWIAHRLSNLHDSKDKKVFHSVVVVTDRRVLDSQLRDVVGQFEQTAGVIARIENNSAELADALKKGTPIIITTLQKFPFVTDEIGKLPKRNYAVIVDEAHSSQSGEAAHKMKTVLGNGHGEGWHGQAELARAEDEEEDYEDVLVREMAARGKQKNLSFFAFTATPKPKTLEFFGTKGADGKPEAFHLYSMRQAIEEGFILDVLKHYTTYKTYYRLVKAIDDDPKVPKKEAAKSLARFMSLHPHNIAQKTEVVIEHFRQHVRKRIGGRAKAMVVTQSRLHAVRYRQAFDKYLAEKGYKDIGVLVAFSGTVNDPDMKGVSYTEPEMNPGVSEKKLPDHFHGYGYQLLIVANKYQTGFDEPQLHTMYVDKRLSGVQAVQTLSRLNRTYPGKEDTFVLDFVNKAEDIQESFQPYYEQTTVSEQAEPQQLYELQHKLDSSNVYLLSEVEAFAKVFYTPSAKKASTDQSQLVKHLDPAVDRFKALEDAAKEEFRGNLTAYVRLYAFLSQVMPFTDADLEKLFSFGRHLENKLPPGSTAKGLKLDGEVALRYYRLQKISEGDLVLEPHHTVGLKGPTEVGTAKAKDEEVRLSQLIDVLNERFGMGLTEADQLLFDGVLMEAKANEDVIQRAKVNAADNFALSMKSFIQDLMVGRLERHEEIVTKYLNDPQFKELLDRELARRAYEEIRGTTGST